MADNSSPTASWRWLTPEFTTAEIMAGLRMGFALAGCTLTAMYLDLESPAWATTTALMITMAGSYGGIIDKGIARFKGTLFAVPLGFLSYNYLINDPWLFSFGVAAISAALVLPSLLRKNNERYVFNVTCSTFILIAIYGLLVTGPQDMLQTIANRVSEVSLGILFSIIATVGTKPDYEVNKLYQGLEQLNNVNKNDLKAESYQLKILQNIELLTAASIESTKISFNANHLELALSKLLLAAELANASMTVELSAESNKLIEGKIDKFIAEYQLAYKLLLSHHRLPKTSNRRLNSLTPTNWQIVAISASRVFFVIFGSLLYWYFTAFQSAPSALMLGCIFISIFSTQIGFSKQLRKVLIATIFGSALGFMFSNQLQLTIPIWQWLLWVLFASGFISGVLMTRAGANMPIVLFSTIFFLSALGLNNIANFDPITSFNNSIVHLITVLQLWLGFMLIPEPSNEYIAKLTIKSIQTTTANAVNFKIKRSSKYFVLQMQRRLQLSQLRGFDIGEKRKRLCNVTTTKGLLALRTNEQLSLLKIDLPHLLKAYPSIEQVKDYLANSEIEDEATKQQLFANVVCFYELDNWQDETH